MFSAIVSLEHSSGQEWVAGPKSSGSKFEELAVGKEWLTPRPLKPILPTPSFSKPLQDYTQVQ